MAKAKAQAAFRWKKTPDKSISLTLGHEFQIVSASHFLYMHILEACRNNDGETAMRLARTKNASDDDIEEQRLLVHKQGLWKLGKRQLTMADSKKVSELKESNVPVAVLTSAVEISLESDSNSSIRSTMLDSPLDSVQAAEIAFYGWVEYLRRYGSTTLDTLDNFDNGMVAVLAKSKSGNKVLLVSRMGHIVVSVEVGRDCTTVDASMQWLKENKTDIYKRLRSQSTGVVQNNTRNRQLG